MSVTSSPNMGLPIPVVGQEPGPQFATDINNSLTILDSHTHTSGSGVPITPSAININSSLSMNNNALVFTGAITYQVQLSDAASQSMYMKGVDFYLRDGSGNVIRLTQSGSVAGSSGTITGLPSGTASASFGGGTFVFQAATNTGANIDGASYIFRNNVANSKGLTLQPPNAMGADYSLTLPPLPPAQQIMTLDNAGNITAPYTVDNSTIEVSSNVIQLKDGGVIAPKMAAMTVGNPASVGEILVTGPSGIFSTNSTTFVALLDGNLTVSSSQRPVCITLTSDNSGPAAELFPSAAGEIQFFNVTKNVTLGRWSINILGNNPIIIPACLQTYDLTPLAGVNQYEIQVRTPSGVTFTIENVRMIAYEI